MVGENKAHPRPARRRGGRLPGSVAGPLLLAEGPETGLSGWRATGYQTFIVLGGLARFKPPAGRVVIALGDDDLPASPAAKALAAWVEECREAGIISS